MAGGLIKPQLRLGLIEEIGLEGRGAQTWKLDRVDVGSFDPASLEVCVLEAGPLRIGHYAQPVCLAHQAHPLWLGWGIREWV